MTPARATATEHAERRTQAQRRAASESALLAAAAELIAERGFEKASLRSIGERAGVSRAMPAYHFGSKDDLVARLVQRGSESTIAAADAVAARNPDRAEVSTLEVLRVIIETYLGSLTGHGAAEERAVVVMWGTSFPSESPLPAVVESDRQTHRALANTIATGQGDGSIRTDLTAETAAWWVMGTARGLAGLSLTHDEVADTPDVRQLAGESIVATLARRA